MKTKNFKKLHARKIDKGSIARNRTSYKAPLPITKLSKPKRQRKARSIKLPLMDKFDGVGAPIDLTAAEKPTPNVKRQKQGFFHRENVDQVAKLLKSRNRRLRIKGLRALKKCPAIKKERILELKNMAKRFAFCGGTHQIDGQLLEAGFRRLHVDAIKFMSGRPACFVTLIDGAFTTSHQQPRINLAEMKRAAHATLRQMAPNYIAFIEFALYNSHKHPEGGRMLSYHVHALTWGGEDPLDRAKIVAKKRRQKFKPNFTGADPIKIKPCRTDEANLACILGYMMKPPHQCPSFYPGKNGRKGNTHHSQKGDRFRYYLRLLQLRSLHTWDQMMFGKGEGALLRRSALKHMKDLSSVEAKTSRSLHADELLPWWADFFADLKIPHYKTPVIITGR